MQAVQDSRMGVVYAHAASGDDVVFFMIIPRHYEWISQPEPRDKHCLVKILHSPSALSAGLSK
jgi:hypothetical protein